MRFEFDSHNLLHVPVNIFHGKEVNLVALIDTGSAGTIFDINKFDLDLFDPNSEVVEVVGIGGTQEEIIQTVDWIMVGQTKVLSFRTQFGDISDGFGFEAIIGSNLLRQLGAIIDYSNQTIEFNKSLKSI